MRERWSQVRIISTIRGIKEAGGKISLRHVMRTQPKLYGAACRHFGGWRKAVEAAGYRYAEHQVNPWGFWTRATVIRAIRRRKRRKLPLNAMAVIASDYPLYLAAVRLFGRNGWVKAVKRAGFQPVNLGSFWSKERVCDGIRKLRRHGVSLQGKYLAEHGHWPLLAAAWRHWRSWRKAVEAAGYDYTVIGGRPPFSIPAWLRTLTPRKIHELERRTLKFARRHRQTTGRRTR